MPRGNAHKNRRTLHPEKPPRRTCAPDEAAHAPPTTGAMPSGEAAGECNRPSAVSREAPGEETTLDVTTGGAAPAEEADRRRPVDANAAHGTERTSAEDA